MLTLSPQARAIAAFALAVLLVMGELNKIGNTLITAIDSNLGQDQLKAAAAVSFVVALAVLWFTTRASATPGETWTDALAQSARLLAVIGVLITALGLLSALLHDTPMGYYFNSVG